MTTNAKEWDGALASRVTEAEVDAAAVELRATLETMLQRVDDEEVQATGVKPSRAIWRPTRPEPSCWLCGELIPGVYATSRVAHQACVAYQEAAR